MSKSTNNLNATARRERALRALANTHPSHLRTRRVRPGSPAARAIKVAIERHTHTVTAMHRMADAAIHARVSQVTPDLHAPTWADIRREATSLADDVCEDCERPVMDTHACDVKPHTLCLDCCGCPDHQDVPEVHIMDLRTGRCIPSCPERGNHA